jgi:hypothetical protein
MESSPSDFSWLSELHKGLCGFIVSSLATLVSSLATLVSSLATPVSGLATLVSSLVTLVSSLESSEIFFFGITFGNWQTNLTDT